MAAICFCPTILVVVVLVSIAESKLLYGCSTTDELCDIEEICQEDGSFGQCRLPGRLALFEVSRLDPDQAQFILSELTRLIGQGFDWTDARTQCVIVYFRLAVFYKFPYDSDFCIIRRPEDVWAVLQVLQSGLDESESVPSTEIDQNLNDYHDDTSEENYPEMNYFDTIGVENGVNDDQQPIQAYDHFDKLKMKIPNYEQSIERDIVPMTKRNIHSDWSLLYPEENIQFNGYYFVIIKSRLPNFDTLSKLDLFPQMHLEDAEYGEREQPISIDPNRDGEQLLLKKDLEQTGNVDLGLSGTEHKIVKGNKPTKQTPIHKVIGNRVYIRMDGPIDRIHLFQLIIFLEKVIGRPNKLTFNRFEVGEKEISFRVSHLADLEDDLHRQRTRRMSLLSASNVAEAVYKHRKDIQTVVGGVQVDETGIGSGWNNLPVDGRYRKDRVVVPTLIICALFVSVLIIVIGLYAVRFKTRNGITLHKIAQDLEAHQSKSYEELCRQRSVGKGGNSDDGKIVDSTGGIVGSLTRRLGSQVEASSLSSLIISGSKTSSIFSWSEEPMQNSNMDIGTGHVILSYLEEYVDDEDRLDREWMSLESFQSDRPGTTIALLDENKPKNRYADVLPYDHTLVLLQSSGVEADITQCGDYINASAVCDSDPRSAIYIVTQAPMLTTAAEFWQMIWEQRSLIIINLTNKLAENGDTNCHRYWPENGSEVHGIFEVHLVSEHIWCEDYLIRSFYLKNLRNNETRTVTQFHFLSWSEGGIPNTTKPLLEFRRKVNKSYRGRLCPVVVHCSDGAGRAGTYCLLDMVLNRINKGVKEMNIAGSLEHLRDQRMKMVRTKQQYKFVLSCVAEEVHTILKLLPQS